MAEFSFFLMSVAQLLAAEPPPISSVQTQPTSWGRFLVYAFLGLGLFLGSAGLGLEIALWQDSAPLIWPPAGIGVVLVLRGGWRYLSVVVLGAALVRLFEGGDALSAAVYAGAYALMTALVCLALLRLAKFDGAMERMSDVLAFMAFGVILGPIISAGLTTWDLTRTIDLRAVPVGQLLSVRWLSDALGVLVIGPISLVWYSRTRINWRNTQAVEVLVWLALLILFGAMIFRNWAPTDTLRYPLELAMFPLMAWAAIRFGQRGATTGILIVAMMAVWELRDVIGPNATHTITQPPGYLWLFVGVLASTSLFLAAVLTEHQNREDEVRINEERLRAFIQAMPDLAFLISEYGRYLEVFVPKKSIFADRASLLRNKTLGEIYPGALAEDFAEVIEEVLRTREVCVYRYAMDYKGRQHWFEARVAPMEAIEGQPRSVIWVAYDISESHAANEALRRRDSLLRAVTEAEASLLKSTDFAAGRRTALRRLSDGVEAAVIGLYEAPDAASDRWVLHDAWSAEEVGIELPTLLRGMDFGVGFDQLRRGENLILEGSQAQPPALAERLADHSGVKGLWMPVYAGEHFWGAMLFLRTERQGAWEASEEVILHSFTTSFGGFVASKQIEDALIQAKAQADAANSAKSEFLAMMSHEIRTPMNAILGFTDILSQTGVSGDQAEYLKIINRSGKDLLELINNILDFSKLESAPIELERVPFRIETTVMEVLEILLIKARDKKLELSYSIDDPTPGVFLGDPLRVRQILLNLVSNAVKFTQIGSVTVHLKVSASEDGRWRLAFAVKDTGIGIPQSALETLFEAFTQVDSSTTREYGGTGLGLTICRRLSESMDGQIRVETEVGKGSNFLVEIVLPMADLEREAETDARPDELDRSFASMHPLRLLLVEDDAINTRLSLEVLRRLGYAPDHAHDGRTAAELLRGGVYEAVILDIQMRQMDGLELTRAVRAGSWGEAARGVHIVALTALASREDAERCAEAGVDQFLSKPFAMRDFKHCLAQAWESVRARTGVDPEEIA